MSNETRTKTLTVVWKLALKYTFKRSPRAKGSPTPEIGHREAFEMFTMAQTNMGKILNTITEFQPLAEQCGVLEDWNVLLNHHEDIRKTLYNAVNCLTDHPDSPTALAARSNAESIISSVKRHNNRVENASSEAREHWARMRLKQAAEGSPSITTATTELNSASSDSHKSSSEVSCWEASTSGSVVLKGNDFSSSLITSSEDESSGRRLDLKISLEMETDPGSNPPTDIGVVSIHPNERADGIIVRIKPTPRSSRDSDDSL
ncbi:hypothetical protein L218DRAFT_992477 [Marasmius fiardii PR-910]|nr:hypothetical protein L218DRAFT_992477 [Marasmius fiardii PR-910]